jgi:hypothetical protein
VAALAQTGAGLLAEPLLETVGATADQDEEEPGALEAIQEMAVMVIKISAALSPKPLPVPEVGVEVDHGRLQAVVVALDFTVKAAMGRQALPALATVKVALAEKTVLFKAGAACMAAGLLL